MLATHASTDIHVHTQTHTHIHTRAHARRVHTLSVPVVTDLINMFRASDHLATACLMAKIGIEKSLNSKLEETRNMLQLKVRGW